MKIWGDENVPVEIKNSKGEAVYVYPGNNLINADLSHKDLKHAVLAGFDCSGANFEGTDLEWAHCRKTIFIGASFKKAYMLHFQGQESDCRNAEWEGANIERAKFQGANLSGSKNWHLLERDFQAKFLGAIMPDGRKVEEE